MSRYDETNSHKVTIMQSSLSRDQVETIDNKLRADFKGPGYYRPNLNFGKKVTQSITIPREDRRLNPLPAVRMSSIDSQESSKFSNPVGDKKYRLNTES